MATLATGDARKASKVQTGQRERLGADLFAATLGQKQGVEDRRFQAEGRGSREPRDGSRSR